MFQNFRHGLLKESFGLLTGAASEWFAKLTSRDYVKNQSAATQTQPLLPAEIIKAQKLVQSTLVCMERAIATHQFEKARFYSYAEHKARKQLRLLQQKYNIVE